MCRSLHGQITAAAAKAKTLLSQLGPLVWAFHERHQCVGDTAEVIAEDPERNVRVAPGISDEVRQQVVTDIDTLVAGAFRDRAMFSSANLREVINRSIVTYAVAVLEQFLDEAGGPLWTCLGGQTQKCTKCGQKRGWPASALTMISTLAGKPSCIDLRLLDHYVNTGWLVLVRNAIIHSNGKAERAGNDARQYKLLCKRGRTPWRRDKSRDQNGTCHPGLVWDEKCGERPSSDWKDRTFSIAIDHFILPRLREAQTFVGEVEQALLKCLRKQA